MINWNRLGLLSVYYPTEELSLLTNEAAPVHQELSRPGLIDAEEAISPVAARIFEYSHRAGIEVKPGLIMNYHSHVTSHQVSRYTERALHVTRRHVMLQRRNKTVKWRLTKTKEFWLNINNGDM